MQKNILQRAASYCAYQERTQNEVRGRLGQWGVWGDEADEIIAELITQNFISEERFARAFAGGKFRIKKWGKRKIEAELVRRGLTPANRAIAITEIGDTEYRKQLDDLLRKKFTAVKSKFPNKLVLSQQLAAYGIRKGYESELVWEVVRKLLGN